MPVEQQFRSLNDTTLQDGLTQQRPATAFTPPKIGDLRNVPVPIDPLPSNPPGSEIRKGQIELEFDRQERVRQQEYIQKQNQLKQAREQEITLREQARRDELRRRIPSAEPRQPRITTRNPAWEAPPKSISPPRSSPATLAPTPRSSGGGAGVQVQIIPAPPPTASPRAPTIQPNPTPGARPSNIPIPAGRFSPPVAGVAADIGFRMLVGQPAPQVLVGGAGNLAGTVVGSLLGGPVGGMVGGFAGGALADYVYKLFAPKKADIPVAPKVKNYILGGQDPGRRYDFSYRIRNATSPGVDSQSQPQTIYGPIKKIQEIYNSKEVVIGGKKFIETRYNFEVHCRDFYGNPQIIGGSTGYYDHQRIGSIPYADNIKISPETSGYPLPSPLPKDKRVPDSIRHPGNQNFVPPSATPAAGKSPAPTNYVPGGSSSRTGGTPRGDSPNWVAPAAPAGSPHPVNMPQPLAAPLPVVMPAPGAVPTTKPSEGDRAYPAARPAGSPGSTTDPSPNAGNFSSPQGAGGGAAILKFPSAAPVTTNVEPKLDALQPVPRPTTPPGTGTAPVTTPDKEQEKLNDEIKDLGLKLAGLTLLIKGLETPVKNIASNTTPAAIQNAVTPAIAPAVCTTTKPGGCSSNMVNDAVNKGNSDLKDFIKNNGLDALTQAEQLRLLNQLDSKMGPQLTGGLAGKLGRMSKWLQLDRAWAMLTYAAVLHNAWMLSSSFGQTLLSATSSFLEAIGIKDEDGSAIDVQALIGKKVEETATSIFGKEKVTYWEKQYKKYVRVYQAAANLLGSLTSIGYSIISVLEVIGSRISRIANALRQFGVVGDNAYSAMNEADSFQNPFFNRITRLEEAASTIDTVSSEVTSVRQTATDIKTQKKALDDSINAATTKQEKTEALNIAKLPIQNVLEDDVPS